MPKLYENSEQNQQLLPSEASKYLCVEAGGGENIAANRTDPSGWETFKLWRITENTFHLRVFHKQFMGLTGNGIDIVAVAKTPCESETFEIVKGPRNSSRVRIKAPNGSFLQVNAEGRVTADSRGDGNWGDNDPSLFVITIFEGPLGEFQVTNGYGPVLAPQVMQEHWSTFIVENDFKFISRNGLNAVRIPVGWWIASDPTPPLPYVGGSLQALDNAFLWAQNYGIKVIIVLHAAPGSQNGWHHSSTRDGSQEWGLSDENIQQTVGVIDFLSARYAENPSLYAVELINEPLSPGVSLDILTKYYREGYNAVRNRSSTAYVIMANRLGPADPNELFPLAREFTGSVIDVHYYNLYTDSFKRMSIQQNMDFVHTDLSTRLSQLTSSNGPLTFVGEWTAEWEFRGATKLDYQKFAKAQLKVYEQASFGWAYWSLKNVHNNWSLEWMINEGYISLKSGSYFCDVVSSVMRFLWQLWSCFRRPAKVDGLDGQATNPSRP
ncbi:hypothetical protein Vadar_031899 [Vaccinium darrowii]|uniref:Uncharacterized protein n=1 Tax=Vaccinium darrowii TaxID=229202 RepID=A0ACB7ZHT8_9ERIC|nr:hypothetical protein Vadar_031899 [Vaccinium darrowii]